MACWIIGARALAQLLNARPAEHQPRLKWPLVAVWPFARGRLQYAAAEHVQAVDSGKSRVMEYGFVDSRVVIAGN